MKNNLLVRVSAALWLLHGLMGCQTTSTIAVPENTFVTPSTDAKVPPGSVINELIKPGVLLRHLSTNAIFDKIEQARSKKKMTVKARSPYSLKVTVQVPNTEQPTEAQIVYTLYRYQQRFWLSAKVYQIANPGTKHENILDVTARVYQEMQTELEHIAKSLAK